MVEETVVNFHLTLLLRILVTGLLQLVAFPSSTAGFGRIHLHKVVLVTCVSRREFDLAGVLGGSIVSS